MNRWSQDRIITPGRLITADSRYKSMLPVEARPIITHQTNSDFKRFVSACREHVWCASQSSSADERESFLRLCECIKPVMIIEETRRPVLFPSFSTALNPDNVKASVRLNLAGSKQCDSVLSSDPTRYRDRISKRVHTSWHYCGRRSIF